MKTIFTIAASVFVTLILLAGIFSWLTVTYPGETADFVINATPSETLNQRIIEPPTTDEQIVNTISDSNPAVVSVIITKDVPIFERFFEEFMPFGVFGGSVFVPRVRQNGSEAREVGGVDLVSSSVQTDSSSLTVMW